MATTQNIQNFAQETLNFDFSYFRLIMLISEAFLKQKKVQLQKSAPCS